MKWCEHRFHIAATLTPPSAAVAAAAAAIFVAATRSDQRRCMEPPLPALVVAASAERFQRAAERLAILGFNSTPSPAVFIDPTPACPGFNGHRLAMRAAWSTIVANDRAMAVFEDDVVAATAPSIKDVSSLAHEIRRHILQHERAHDVIWLGGMGRLGRCNHAGCFRTGKALGGTFVFTTFYTDHAKWITPRGAAFLLSCTGACITQTGWATDSIVKHVCEPPPGQQPGTAAQWTGRKTLRDTHCPAAWRAQTLSCRPPDPQYATQITKQNPWLVFMGFFWQQRKGEVSHNDKLRASAGIVLTANRTEEGFRYGSQQMSHGCHGFSRFGSCRRCQDLVACEAFCNYDARCRFFHFVPGGYCGLYSSCDPKALTGGDFEVARFYNFTQPLKPRVVDVVSDHTDRRRRGTDRGG